jgi:hypothetical protein
MNKFQKNNLAKKGKGTRKKDINSNTELKTGGKLRLRSAEPFNSLEKRGKKIGKKISSKNNIKEENTEKKTPKKQENSFDGNLSLEEDTNEYEEGRLCFFENLMSKYKRPIQASVNADMRNFRDMRLNLNTTQPEDKTDDYGAIFLNTDPSERGKTV